MRRPRAENYADEDEYKLALYEFRQACKNGDLEAIASDINNKYYAKIRKEKYKRWEKLNENKIFCDGLRVEEKEISQNFKIIKLGIKADEFMNFIAKYTNEKGYVNIDIKTSKNGKMYAELNTYGLNLDTTNQEEPKVADDEEVPF